MNALLAIVLACIMMRLGGWGGWKFLWLFNAKWWRWFGLGYCVGACYQNWYAIPTYYLATNISYGENSPLNKLGRDVKWLIYGACFGLASFPILGMWALVQAVSGAIGFWGLMKLSNDGINGWKMNHCFVELLFPIWGLQLLMYIR